MLILKLMTRKAFIFKSEETRFKRPTHVHTHTKVKKEKKQNTVFTIKCTLTY